jgi:hypothetical protein
MESASHLLYVISNNFIFYNLLELILRQQLVIVAINALYTIFILPLLLLNVDTLLDVGYGVIYP